MTKPCWSGFTVYEAKQGAWVMKKDTRLCYKKGNKEVNGAELVRRRNH